MEYAMANKKLFLANVNFRVKALAPHMILSSSIRTYLGAKAETYSTTMRAI
jgi:hypothetical protein